MTLLQRLLLLPCLTPLLAVLLVASLNLKSPVRLRLLVWESPTFNLGGWMALGSSAGAIMALATGLTLAQTTSPLRRQVRQKANSQQTVYVPSSQEDINYQEPPFDNPKYTEQVGPERDIRDPLPTISVPFRVVNRIYEQDDESFYDEHDRYQNEYRDEYIEPNSSPRDTNEEFPLDQQNTTFDNSDWGKDLSEDW